MSVNVIWSNNTRSNLAFSRIQRSVEKNIEMGQLVKFLFKNITTDRFFTRDLARSFSLIHRPSVVYSFSPDWLGKIVDLSERHQYIEDGFTTKFRLSGQIGKSR